MNAEEKISQEIQTLNESIQRGDAAMREAEKAHDKACVAERRAWEKVERRSTPAAQAAYLEAVNEQAKALKRLWGLIDSRTRSLERIAQLQNPVELERRKEKEAKVVAVREKYSAKAREPQDCFCGCNGQTKGGKFLPGHDARLKSKLIGSVLNGKSDERKRAEARIIELGWQKHLAKAKDKVAA